MVAPVQEFAPILLSFLEDLDALYDEDPGVTDTDVREILATVIIERLVKANPDHAIPNNFEMLDEEGELSATMNRRVESVVRRFVSEAEASSAWQACRSNAERQALVARDEVTTHAGNAYWLYLGPWDRVWQRQGKQAIHESVDFEPGLGPKPFVVRFEDDDESMLAVA